MSNEHAGSSGDGALRALETILLVQKYREGNERALEVLFERYSKRVERIVYIRSGPFLESRGEAADLVQDVLLKMLKDLDHYEVREDARFIDWAATICERTLRNRVRFHTAEKRDVQREQRLPLRNSSNDSSVEWDVVAGDLPPPERLSRQESEQLVDDCIKQLRDEHREVILLRDFAGASWDYVTLAIGKESKGAAQQLHRRARVALGELLRAREDDSSR